MDPKMLENFKYSIHRSIATSERQEAL